MVKHKFLSFILHFKITEQNCSMHDSITVYTSYVKIPSSF